LIEACEDRIAFNGLQHRGLFSTLQGESNTLVSALPIASPTVKNTTQFFRANPPGLCLNNYFETGRFIESSEFRFRNVRNRVLFVSIARNELPFE
jgi:hypothetical protein